jgi:hypothetical protein
MTMNFKLQQLGLAVWQYLNQPILFSNQESIWKPSRFWYIYKIRFLETCWYQEPVIPSHEIRGQDEYRTGN